jgi:hypothetical protein
MSDSDTSKLVMLVLSLLAIAVGILIGLRVFGAV